MKRFTGNLVLLITLALLSFVWVGGCTGGSDLGLEELPSEDGDDENEADETDGDTELDDESDGDAIEEDGDDVEQETLGEKEIAMGIYWLENGEAYLARDAFKAAFELDNANPQARFGYAFSEANISWDTLFLVIQTLIGLPKSSMGAEMKAIDDYEDINDWLDKEFLHALTLINEGFLKAVELYGPLKESGGLSMHFDHLPVYMGLKEMRWMSGEIDDADVFIFDGMARFAATFFEFLAGHSLKTDLYGIIPLIEAGVLNEMDVMSVLGIVTYLMNEDDNFLKFRGPNGSDGLASIENTRLLLLGALEDALMAAEAAEDEWGTDSDQTDEVFSVEEDRQKNKSLVLNVWRYTEDGEGIKEAYPIITSEVVLAVNALRNQIATGNDGTPIPMHNEVTLSLSAMLMLPIGYGLLDYFGFDLEEQLGLTPDLLSPNMLSTTIRAIMNVSVMAFDFYAYYQNPLPLRDMLPAYTTDKEGFDNTMYMEWECPAELTDDGLPDGTAMLFCAGAENTFSDVAHFVGTDYEIPMDGVAVATPYIAMQSPDFGGLLYVDPISMGLEGYPEEPQFQKADNLSFNAAVAEVLKGVLAFIGGSK